MSYFVKCLRYSAFILEFYIPFNIILIGLTGDCFINKLKLRDPFKSYEIVGFHLSINVMWIHLFVFQTPEGFWFAEEIGLEFGFI